MVFENGERLLLDKDAELVVNRNGEQLVVYADELQEGDDIQFDNCDLLHTLPNILQYENSIHNQKN